MHPSAADARRVKIVATLGPATDGQEAALVEAGVDVVRLNFSHGVHAEHARRASAVRAAARALGRSVAVLQDLQGPKIRIGTLEGGGPVTLVEGQTVRIWTDPERIGTAADLSTTYAGLADDVRPGDRILLDDGHLRLTALESGAGRVVARVEQGGPLGEHKGINLPGVCVSAPALTDKDRADLCFGLAELGVDYVALSFVRSAAEVREARALIRSLGYDTPVIVKLEKSEAIDDLEAIVNATDGGLMVARGDLGVELEPERVPVLQKRIVERANARGLPVITATQMLESMTREETPTRAEASDVANAVWDGTDAVMLSGETAAGRHPLRVVQMMDRIVRTAEAAESTVRHRHESDVRRHETRAAAVTHAARVLADDVQACAIVGITRTGRTAELLSRGRAHVPIYAFSPDEQVCRRLALWWGVTPVEHAIGRGLEANVRAMQNYLLGRRLAEPGSTIVIAGSHPFERGVHTNFVKYQVLEASPPTADAAR